MFDSDSNSDYRYKKGTDSYWTYVPTVGVCPTCGHCPTCGRRHPPYPPPVPYTPTPGSFILC